MIRSAAQSPASLPRRLRALARAAVLTVVVVAVAGCGWGNVVPSVPDRTITISDVSETTFTVSWSAADNDPLFSDFLYEIYTADRIISSSADLTAVDALASGSEKDFGDEALTHTATGLSRGTSYYVTVAVSPADGGTTVLYQGVVQATLGTTPVASDLSSTPFEHIVSAPTGLATTYDLSVTVPSLSSLYFVFTNPQSAATAAPLITGSVAGASPSRSTRSVSTADRTAPIVSDRPIVMETRDELSPSNMTSPSARGSFPEPDAPRQDLTVNSSTETFLDYYDGPVEIPATLRAERTDTDTGKTLYVWVADDSWGTIDGTMVDHLADSFILEGSNEHIHDWITNVYGEEWGAHGDSNLIADTDTITILLYDIDFDNSANGGVVGYFWAKDNYKRTSSGLLATSNQRVMFYLDSVLYATPTGGTWETTDYWPEVVISTLAHEFQHMIHFYQRDVLEGTTTPTWINEMLSMIAEDLIADKLGVPGPRGVDPSTGDAGPAPNGAGRFPDYNELPYTSLSIWGDYLDEWITSYGLSYSFGAFLTRAYAGAPLARKLVVNNPYSTADSILSHGTGASLDKLLRRWGVAILLSDDDSSTPAEVRMNSGTWFPSSVGSVGYNLGSVNAFNYLPDGPVVYSSSTYDLTELEPTSALFYEFGTGLAAGTVNTTLSVPGGTQLTVVVK